MTTEPDRITAPTQNNTVVSDGLAALYLQFQGMTKIEGLLTPWLVQAQKIEDALWHLLAVNLSNAYGSWLDVYGRILGQARGSMTDDVYRVVLEATILANRSSGTVPQLEAITALLLNATGASPYTLTEWYPAAMVIEPVGAIGITGAVAIPVLRRARLGGVALQLIDPPSSGAAVTCAPGILPLVGPGEGFSDVAQDTGGYWAGVQV